MLFSRSTEDLVPLQKLQKALDEGSKAVAQTQATEPGDSDIGYSYESRQHPRCSSIRLNFRRGREGVGEFLYYPSEMVITFGVPTNAQVTANTIFLRLDCTLSLPTSFSANSRPLWNDEKIFLLTHKIYLLQLQSRAVGTGIVVIRRYVW